MSITLSNNANPLNVVSVPFCLSQYVSYEMLGSKTEFHKTALAYGLIGFSIAITHNVFIFYFLALFLRVHGLRSDYFYLGQSLFLIWNSLNDAVFGWMLDGANAATSV